jgi:hypothetical protein
MFLTIKGGIYIMGSTGNSVITTKKTTSANSNLNNKLTTAYQAVLDKAKANAKANPNNLTYQNMVFNYTELVKATKATNIQIGKTYSGTQAIVALDSQTALGFKVAITIDGKTTNYTLKYWSQSGFYGGKVWENEDGSHFSSDTSTILSSLYQLRGGKLKNDKTVKVKLLGK